MTRLRAIAAALLAGAVTLWFWRDDAAWFLAGQAPGLGFPLLGLLVRATAVLLAAVGAYRLRGPLGAAGAEALRRIDAADERIQTLPRATALAVRAATAGVLVGVAVTAVVELTHASNYLETRAFDLFFRLRFPEHSQVELATGRELASAHKQDDVVVVALDDETVNHLGWPMPRVYYAQLIDAVARAKPKSLAFDVSLVDPAREHPEWDLAVEDAARRAGNVVFSFSVARSAGDSRRVLSDTALKALDASSIPWHESAAGLPEYSEIVGGDAAPQPVVDPVARAARSIAMANVLLDGDDDVLRHSLLVARLKNRLLPSLSLRLAAQELDVPLDAIRVYPGSHVDLGGKRRVPIDALGRTLVRYQGRHDAHGTGPFRYVSIWSLLRSDSSLTITGNPMGEDQSFRVDDQTQLTRDGKAAQLADVEALLKKGAAISGKARYSPDPGRILELEVITGAPGQPDFEILDEQTLRFTSTIATSTRKRGDASLLAGKHVLVGSTALAAADLRNSPLGELPGVEHHATMLANLLHDDFFHPAPAWASPLLVLGAALLAAGIGVGFTAGLGFLFSALLWLGLMTASFAAMSSGHSLPVVGPSAAVWLTYLLCLVLGARAARAAHARVEGEREFVRRTFGRYLTEQVVQQLLDSPDGLKLGGHRAFVTIMMTDLRGFTSMCGSMVPEDVVRLLNHYLETMTRIIARYGGTIDEFIGDAILVVFGAPLPIENAETRAVACSIQMLNAMVEVNRWNTERGLPAVEMGIGVHSGEVVLGNIGSELRAKYGIVGSTINLTSRVESFTVGGQVLISEATRERCADALTLGGSQVVSPKGVKGTLTIHEVFAVAAPFDVRLQGTLEKLVAPRAPLELRYGLVKNKQVAELSHVAHVEALSEQGMELRVAEDLPALSDLQLRVLDGGALRPGDLYGKVLKANVRASVVYLRLTSVPPELRPVLDAARGENAPPVAVPESALVST